MYFGLLIKRDMPNPFIGELMDLGSSKLVYYLSYLMGNNYFCFELPRVKFFFIFNLMKDTVNIAPKIVSI